MGFIGNTVGVVLGLTISWILAKTDLIRLPSDVYYIDHLPIQIALGDILAIIVAASALILLASLYPAHKAAKLNPLEAIRYG